MIAAYHPMDLDLFVDAGEVFFADVCDLNDFARVDLLCWVYCGAHCLLLRTLHVLEQVRGELGFADFSVLALPKDIIHEDNEVIYFANLGLFGGSLVATCRTPPRILVVPLRGVGSTSIRRAVINSDTLGCSRLNARLLTTLTICHAAFDSFKYTKFASYLR